MNNIDLDEQERIQGGDTIGHALCVTGFYMLGAAGGLAGAIAAKFVSDLAC